MKELRLRYKKETGLNPCYKSNRYLFSSTRNITEEYTFGLESFFQSKVNVRVKFKKETGLYPVLYENLYDGQDTKLRLEYRIGLEEYVEKSIALYEYGLLGSNKDDK